MKIKTCQSSKSKYQPTNLNRSMKIYRYPGAANWTHDYGANQA